MVELSIEIINTLVFLFYTNSTCLIIGHPCLRFGSRDFGIARTMLDFLKISNLCLSYFGTGIMPHAIANYQDNSLF